MIIIREDVIRTAKQYLNISGWAPVSDTVSFEEEFASCFLKAKMYDVFPYVYGGFDSIAKFVSKVGTEDKAPGGWDRKTGKTTSNFLRAKEVTVTQIVKEGEEEVEVEKKIRGDYLGPRYLAGIDCSGFVTRCWSLGTKKGTTTIPLMCLEINKADLRKGDVLNKARNHVIIFEKWTNDSTQSSASVYESVGGSYGKRAFREGDTRGRVIHHTRNWSWFERRDFTSYSPFPQFTELIPVPATYIEVTNLRPIISVKCVGSGDIEVIDLSLDKASVPSSVRSGRASYVPHYDLTFGRHTVEVTAINRVVGQSFISEYSWGFELYS